MPCPSQPSAAFDAAVQHSVTDEHVALVTSWDGTPDRIGRAGHGYQCALLHWCNTAATFGEMLVRNASASRVDVLVLVTLGRNESDAERRTQAVAVLRSECPSLSRVLFAPVKLQRVAEQYLATSGTAARDPRFQRHAKGLLLRWYFTSLEPYALVLFSDLDVELLPPANGGSPREHIAARWRATWRDVVPAARTPRLFAGPDHWSPWNGGVWSLAWPSQRLYEAGLDVLSCAQWNWSHGFNHMGRPRELSRSNALARELLFPYDPRHKRHTRTRALERNTWDFYASDLDQVRD